jgi:peptidoglycan/LPS O-acetylase OafA/YrhL
MRPDREYLPALDGVRALAIAAVMVFHLTPLGSLPHLVPLGFLGVRLFFVLSGFLITRILLDGRRSVARGEVASREVLRRFYIRRALRILPIYYMTILVAAGLHLSAVRDDLAWYATFTSNWMPLFVDRSGTLGHLWSLAVEEQFYLFWPFLIMLLPEKWVTPAILAAIATGPFTRFLLALTNHDASMGLTPGCLDTLGCGALLARLGDDRGRAMRLVTVGSIAGLPLSVVLASMNPYDNWNSWSFVYGETGLALLFTSLVGYLVFGPPGIVRRVFELPPIRYVGRISYGLYLYHAFAMWVPPVLFRRLHLTYPTTFGPMAVTGTVLSFLLAMLSWRMVEAPINGLKRFFPYATLRARQVEPAGEPAG